MVSNFQKKEINIEKTPKQNKKRTKRLSPVISEVTINESEIVDSGRESTGSSGSLRPVRTTRGVTKCYKELPVNTKMRRDDESNVTIKKERVSDGKKSITISKVQSLAEEEKQTKRSSSNSSTQEDAKKVKVSFYKLIFFFFLIQNFSFS